MNQYEAAIFLKMSPRLLKWFTSYAPKFNEERKLKYRKDKCGMLNFEKEELIDFNKYLSSPWPFKDGKKRPYVPSSVEYEIKAEARFSCVVCDYPSAEVAHIDPVHNSKNNHPHNLIYLCPNDHDLFDKKRIIKHEYIKKLKDDILHTKLVIWKSNLGLFDAVSSLIKELENINLKDFENKELQRGLISELLNEIKNHVSSNFNPSKSELTENTKNYINYKKNINKIINESSKVEEDLFKQRNAYFIQSNIVECPLCNGTGEHNYWECQICKGDGTVDREIMARIDLSPFEQIECPLCNGNGEHNYWECQICRGVGTVDKEGIEEYDPTQFEQIMCPLCKGSKIHNEDVCPACRGVGTVDKEGIGEYDPSQFEQIKCPLCKGSKIHNEDVCPACKGVGTVDKEGIGEYDPSQFEQIKCPLCKGSKIHNEDVCPACKGVGTVDKEGIGEYDPSQFEQIKCPLCKGSKIHNEDVCPACKGVGTVDKEGIGEYDSSWFE